ncbi:MAG TPA: 3'-5' exonuclease [Chloroflexota bacterium]
MTALATPLSSVSFVSVDVETTGLDPYKDQIIEIGAVKVRDGKVVGEFDTLVAVSGTIPWDAQQVHGINNAMLVGKPAVTDAIRGLLEFLGDGTLVEHSHKAFDAIFLEQAYGSRFEAPYINTCTLSRRLFPHIPKHSLKECCRRFQIDNARPHRALGDAHATATLLLRLLELCSTRYPKLEDLMAVASIEREWIPAPKRARGARRSMVSGAGRE